MGNFKGRSSSNRESIILSSLWTGLSPHLIARFFPVKKVTSGGAWEQGREKHTVEAGDETYEVDDGYEVHAPISDGNSELALSWSSPFGSAGAESKAPMLSALLQSGSLTSTLQYIASGEPSIQNDLAKKSADFLRQIEGRTGITKLNSTQIFTGMPPVKMALTLHFRALRDPVMEVRDPIQKLKEWAVPQLLSSDGLIGGAVRNGTKRSLAHTLFPSAVPQVIGMKYGDGLYSPMVIESVSEPFTNPRSDKGVMLSCSLQMTLATLTAIDRRDVQKMYV